LTQRTGPGGIFISYRREESAPQAGRLYDNLSQHFGEERVFMDVDSIGLGLDFVEVVQDALSSCEILLALIGTEWVDITDEQGNRRLDDPNDFRIELETALKRNVRVVPTLLNGAPLPRPAQLPTELHAIVRRQALELDDTTFRTQVRRLIENLERVLPSQARGNVPAPDRTAVVASRQDQHAGESQARESWSGELLERSNMTWLVKLNLSFEEHIVQYRGSILGDPKLEIDGTRVFKGYVKHLADKQFTVSDGDTARILTIDGEWVRRILGKTVSVQVDGSEVLRFNHPED
jgi:TIR domain